MPEIQGEHVIADEVIASIVVSAAGEVPGVYLSSGGFVELFGKKQSAKGIRIDQQEEGVLIDIKIGVDYGISIPQLCETLQKKIAERVTEITGKKVSAVNVFVSDINMKSISAEESEEKGPEKTEQP